MEWKKKTRNKGTQHVDVRVIGMVHNDDASVRVYETVRYILDMSGAHIPSLSKPDDKAK